MAEPITDDYFIVISGHDPRTGKRERISRVRTHITKRHFRRLHYRGEAAQIEAERQLIPCSGASHNHGRGNASRSLIGNELCSSLPLTNRLVDPSPFFAVETSQRMRKFFDIHLRGYMDSHPFYRNVVRWAISDPHFASAKLLNASAWDDIHESGELSVWTSRQRFITVRLLNDALSSKAAVEDTNSILAAIQSLLGFELLIGNNDNINRLQDFYRSLVTQQIQTNNDVWTVLTRCHYVLSYADRLHRIGNDHDHRNQNSLNTQHPDEKTCLYPQEDHYQFEFPGNFSLFTFGQPTVADDQNLFCVMLCDLYHILAIAASSQTASVSCSAYEYVVAQHEKLLQYSTERELADTDASTAASATELPDANDLCSTPLRLSTFILTSYFLSNRDKEGVDENESLSNLASRLRALLSSTLSGLHINTNWMAFPGALMWCHAIGLRFAGTQFDRTWFMMQFLRVAQLSALETWEEMSRSIKVIVCGLEAISG